MLVPSHFEIKDQQEALDFIKSLGFGILSSNGPHLPEATHLAFVMKEENEELILYTHLARANPHCIAIENNKNIKAIFSGPHAYISPAWYVNKINVPTWNYTAVHVTGDAELIKDKEGKINVLKDTIQANDPDFVETFLRLPDEYKNAMYGELIGVRIKVTGIQTQFKLSQNKPKEDILPVIEKLENSGNSELAKLMLKFNQSKIL